MKGQFCFCQCYPFIYKTVARVLIKGDNFVSFSYGISTRSNPSRQHLQYSFSKNKSHFFYTNEYLFRLVTHHRCFKTALLKERKLKNHIIKKAYKNKPLAHWEKKFNKLIGKVEHTFGGIKRWFSDRTKSNRCKYNNYFLYRITTFSISLIHSFLI